jgi:hypothetical protein
MPPSTLWNVDAGAIRSRAIDDFSRRTATDGRACGRSVRERFDQQHTQLDTPKEHRADDDLLTVEKRIHPGTSLEEGGQGAYLLWSRCYVVGTV